MSHAGQAPFDRAAAVGAITRLIGIFGLAVLADSRRLESGLNDLLPSHLRERRVLVVAAYAGLLEDLVTEVRDGRHDRLRERIAEDRLQREFSLQPRAARWTLRCWREGIADALSSGRQMELDRQEAEIREAGARVRALMAEGRYQAALTELLDFRAVLPNMDALFSRCEARVQEADRAYGQAMQAGASSEHRASLLLEALRLCADHRAAREELSKIPPPPPRDLMVAADADGRVVHLSWHAPSEPGCSFIIMRADAAEFPAVMDPSVQQRLASVGVPHWDDYRPPIGVPMRYAVYAERHGRLSEQAAVSSEPIFLAPPPTLLAKPGDGLVELSWTRPANSASVEIVRTEIGAKTDPVTMLPGSSVQLVDTGVRNNVRYRYTARATYPISAPGDRQETRYSKEASSEVIPGPVPEPPRGLSAQSQPVHPSLPFCRHAVALRWPEPERGVIRIIRSAIKPALKCGDGIPAKELTRHLYLLREGTQPLIDRWYDDMTLCYYLPVLVVGEFCYVGEARHYAASPEISELTATYGKASIQLSWTWPAEVSEALVAWGTEKPDDATVAPHHAYAIRDAMDPAGRFGLPDQHTKQVFIRVAAVVRDGDTRFISTGALTSVQRPAVQLSYEVRTVRRLGSRQPELRLSVSRPARLPSLELRGRADGRPVARTDSLLMRIAATDIDRDLDIRLPRDKMAPIRSYRLFLTDEQEAGNMQIIDP